jgi:predicted AAA+ superfamily ATPase
MDAFFRTHNYLIDHLDYPVERLLMKEIDWSQRLIGIKGSRGMGKTTFLLACARELHPNNDDRACLYINLNNLYFTTHTLVDFADEFRKRGGKVLLIDQINKYPDWSHELREIYDTIPDLKIVFSGSSIIRLKEENPDLDGIAHSYNLRGFSFREFLNRETGNSFEAYTLEEIIENHQEIANSITSKIRPLAYFQDYVHHGYYPFYLDETNYSETLLKVINFILEIDITNLRQERSVRD